MPGREDRDSGNNPGGTSSENPVALVLADFMFGARVQSALAQMGWTPVMTPNPGGALERIRDSPPLLLLVELGAGNPARIQFLRDLRALPEGAQLPVLAFGSHKAKPMLEEARAAGATLVVSNGTLVSRFPDVVQKACDAALPESERLLIDEEE
jgi:CheY-like chemotaxis protein